MTSKDINILIVEDEVISLNYLVSLLETLGYKYILNASDMQGALSVVREHEIDLVFMDININGPIDGITCAKSLNREYELPIIFTTAYSDIQTIAEASEVNIFGYLVKPFDLRELTTALLVAIKRISDKRKQIHLGRDNNDTIIDLGNNQKFSMTTSTFYSGENIIDLTRKESKILNLLCANMNQNVSYIMLKNVVWQNKNIQSSTIRDSVSRLKRKTPDLNIVTIIGLGYILKKWNDPYKVVRSTL